MPIAALPALGHYDAVYLSPHLDDVALSCTGALAADRRAGRHVLVATFFTEGDASYVQREQEDTAALLLLGVDGVWAGLRDAPFRSERYRSFAGILLDDDPADAPLARDAAAWLTELLERTTPERLVAPLGVGGHVDHRLVHRLAAASTAPHLRFYEDRPYALVRGQVERRLRELGSDTPELNLRAHLRLVRDWARAGYVHSYASPLDALRAPRIRARTEATAEAEAVRWRSELVVEGPETEALATQALACYGSQWPLLFRSLRQHERQTRRYGITLGPEAGYVERLWRRT